MEIAKRIDHTLLKPDATSDDIKTLCKEAILHGFHSVCIHPSRIEEAKECLGDEAVKITTVIGFPLGANTTATKVQEIEDALQRGADELDVVQNVGWVKEKRWETLREEYRAIRRAAKDHCLKMILETGSLTEDEIIACTRIAREEGYDYVKTSTGFVAGGATLDAVETMKAHAGNGMKVKASGGIGSKEEAEKMIEAGADRLGTSRSLQII
ncbi:MAG: deoxyribose-phosphate aldolase [Tissierellia bacterium]|nr:deoxyribose-phosphate aldolase [Tissierellia bacterium]